MDTYAGDPNNYPSVVRYIEDGDAPNETNFFPSVEDLADRTATLNNRFALTAVTRTLVGYHWSSTYWDLVFGNQLTSLAGNVGQEVIFPLDDLPEGATLNQVDVIIQGASGHGALPSQMPRVRTCRLDITTGIGTVLDTGTDSVASVAAYENVHTVSSNSTVMGIAIQRATKGYFVQFLHESGTNRVEAGLIVYAARAIYTLPANRTVGGI